MYGLTFDCSAASMRMSAYETVTVPPIMFVAFVVPIAAFPIPGPLVPGITLVDIESVPSSTFVAVMAVVPAGACVSLEALAALVAPGPS